MKNRTPVPRDARPALPAFEPVPRKPRHDGWTPARQVTFIEALADMGSVSRAAAAVNMTSESAYALRRAPQADSFARAWSAAIDMGLLRLKDEAFDRALNGQLVPVIAGGKLLGYRRKKNDRLIMFVLRHYGQDGEGRRVMTTPMPPARRRGTRAPRIVEGAPAEPKALPAPARSPAQAPADPLAAFTGVELDAEAQDAIAAILQACAARAREQEPGDDPDQPFLGPQELRPDHPDAVEPPAFSVPSTGSDAEGDEDWRTLDRPDQRDAIAAAVARHEAMEVSGELAPQDRRARAQQKKADFRSRRMQAFIAADKQSYEWEDWCRDWKG